MIYRSLLRSPQFKRFSSTLASNPSIHHFPHPSLPDHHVLSLLPTSPPTLRLAIGTTHTLPPTSQSFSSNPNFLKILSAVLAKNAIHDPAVIAQTATYASNAGFSTTSTRRGHSSSGAGPSAFQGGAGGAGRGGWIHVSDERRPPEWGRIADPEDIFGSLEVDGEGRFVGGDGGWQDSGTYRVVTRDGILGLSSFLRDKLVERLTYLERTGEEFDSIERNG